MAKTHLDYAGHEVKNNEGRLHLDFAGKEIPKKTEVAPVKGSLLKWGWQPSSLQAATVAKAKAAELAAKQKKLAAVGKVPLAPARYPGQPTTAANLEILKNRILGKQSPLVPTAGLPGIVPGAPVQASLPTPDLNFIGQQQSMTPGTDLFRTRFPVQAAKMRLNANQQQASDQVLNMFQNKASGNVAPISGWMGI